VGVEQRVSALGGEAAAAERDDLWGSAHERSVPAPPPAGFVPEAEAVGPRVDPARFDQEGGSRVAGMREIAPGVVHLPLVARQGINAYLIGDVIVDAGLASSAKKIVKAVAGRPARAHALTHAHVDHAGGSRRLVDMLELPLWAPAGDAADVVSGEPALATTRLRPLMAFVGGFDGLDVARELREGDEIAAGFVVVELPGHSPGQVGYWRESDRVLLAGDVLTNMNLLTTKVGLHLPPDILTVDPARNRESARRVAALEPRVVGFGHGPVLHDAAAAIGAFVGRMS
jgi:glyoxylase-like metal-dependent hydrolase (beta-lactamase superfamily II)